MQNKKIASLDGLRFVMIMVIVFCHFNFFAETYLGNFWKHIANFSMAVNYFFMLSGFGLMMSAINRGKSEISSFKECINFGINHVRKIYPVYIATIIVGLLLLILSKIKAGKSAIEILFSTLIKLAVNIPLFQSATGMMAFTHAFNGVSWFLSSLFCIYIVAPNVIYFLRKHIHSVAGNLLSIFVCIFMSILLAFLFGKIEARFPSRVDYLVYASPYRRIFYVIPGMCLALIYSEIKNKAEKLPLWFWNFAEIFVILICVFYHIFRVSIFKSEYSKYAIDMILCALLVFVVSFNKGVFSKLFSTSIFQTLGQMAMFIFLIHYPIIIYFGSLTRFFHLESPAMSIFATSSDVVISLLISYLIYKKQSAVKQS